MPVYAWVFIDRWKEFGGLVTADNGVEITLTDGTETRSFNRGQVLEVVTLVNPHPNQRGVVQMRDGSEMRAVILADTPEGVRFRVDKVEGLIGRERVFRVILEPDFGTRYATIKAGISKDEHGRRLALAKWLINEKRLDLAKAELEQLLRDSDNEDARTLLRSVNAQIKLAEATQAEQQSQRRSPAPKQSNRRPLKKDVTNEPVRADPPAQPTAPAQPATTPAQPTAPAQPATEQPGTASQGSEAEPAPPQHSTESEIQPDDPPPGPPRARDLLPKDLLTNDEVNLIRVYEIDFKDPPRLRVDPEGVRQLILRYGNSSLIPATTQERNALYTKNGDEIARLMFDLKARDLYRYIEVQEDPASLARFRTRVHNSWLINKCGTARCHGGVQAGAFFLYTGNAKDSRIRYTNLMTLLTFQVDGKPLVNFESPGDSLLIQYAMPRNQTRYPHPDIKGWQPVFTQSTPQLMTDTLEWIRGMYQPRPTYPVDYKAPKLNAPDTPAKSPDGPDR